jgi:hypothetical protein
MDAVNASYPAALTIETPDQIDRWRPFVQWFLAIPQLLILRALDALSSVVALISWFTILFTGKLPEGLAGLQALYLRSGSVPALLSSNGRLHWVPGGGISTVQLRHGRCRPR